MKKTDHIKRGIALADNEAHQADHNLWSRRSFLQNLGIVGGTGLALGGFSINALANNSLLPLTLNGAEDDRILVLIRLNGGNDGLNTIVPLYQYSKYQSERPNIALENNDMIGLNNDFGMNKSLEGLMSLWNQGAMKVVNTVGYEDHNLSHFRSTDIWSSGSDSNVVENSGWLGRYILDQDPDILTDPPKVPAAIKIGGSGIIAFNNADQVDLSVNFVLPEDLSRFAQVGSLYDVANLPDTCYYGEQVGFLRSMANSTLSYAETLKNAYDTGQNAVNYSNNILSRQLAIIAKLIKGGLKTKLYLVTLNGFDTHADQLNGHNLLLSYLGSAVDEFYRDLETADRAKDVLSMTFSEFGRRVNQNASRGTDHGTAAPLLLFGPGLNGNDILGDNPNLNDLDRNGNLKYSVDFRSIYASILESWLCLDPVSVDAVLGQNFERLDLGLECSGVVSTDNQFEQKFKHYWTSGSQGETSINYELSRPAEVSVEVFTLLGQSLGVIKSGYHLPGEHKAIFAHPQFGLTINTLVYRITVDKNQYSDKFIVGK